MSEQPSLEQWEANVRHIAHNFSYPPTPPNLASAIRQQTTAQPARMRPVMAWAAALSACIVVGLFAAMPGARTQVMAWIGLGGTPVWQAEPTATLVTPTLHRTPERATITGLPSPTLNTPGSAGHLLTATPQPSSTPLYVSTHVAGSTVSPQPMQSRISP